MMTVRRQVFFRLCAAIITCILATACGQASGRLPVTVEMAKKFVPRSVNEIAVLPFERGLGDSSSEGNISDAGLADAESRLIKSVQLNTTFALKNAADPDGVRKTVLKYIPRRGTAREQAVYVGRDLNVQAVLYGTLSKYTELQGSSLGSEIPAAVACTLWLVDAQTGEILWSARFADNDRPLSENIFRIRRRLSSGVGHSTAAELLEAGFKEALARLEAEHTAR